MMHFGQFWLRFKKGLLCLVPVRPEAARNNILELDAAAEDA